MPFPRKILAIKLRAMGDTVLMTAPLAELRRAYPEAEIHALVLRPWTSLLEPHPAVDRVWAFDRHKETTSRAKAVARIALQLRRERYDTVVNFHASPSSSTIAFATGAPVRSIHFHGHKDRNRYSTVEIPGKGTLKPNIERDMDVVRALGLDVPAGRMPRIHLQHTESDLGLDRIERLGLADPLLAIGLGASRPTKSWPAERFAALAVRWRRETGGGVVAFTGPGEDELARQFLRLVDDELVASVPEVPARAPLRAGIVSETGLPIRLLAAMLRHAAVFVGNDSGPKHLAVAVDTPTVTMFGPEDPFEWHPYHRTDHPILFIEGLSCRRDAAPGMPAWCGLDVCVKERHRCMRDIGIDPVFDACRSVARL